ncbi:MAG: SPOR domain-containing protein [Acidobacteriia bacterium]|nr:SPOR domain-containing protein [Terriglobia bacterium]
MATKRSSGQYELVLENRQLVFILFGAVLLCGIFFTLGFLVGREQRDLSVRNDTSKLEGQESAVPTNKLASKKEVPPLDASKPKKADQDAINKELTFYKTVEGKSGENPKVNPKEEASGGEKGKDHSSRKATTAPPKTLPVASASAPANTIIYQIAALSKSDDAQALVRKLKEKGFQAFLVSPPGDSGSDKLYRVQVGPFSDSNVAEQIKAKLVANGYTPITKK